MSIEKLKVKREKIPSSLAVAPEYGRTIRVFRGFSAAYSDLHSSFYLPSMPSLCQKCMVNEASVVEKMNTVERASPTVPALVEPASEKTQNLHDADRRRTTFTRSPAGEAQTMMIYDPSEKPSHG